MFYYRMFLLMSSGVFWLASFCFQFYAAYLYETDPADALHIMTLAILMMIMAVYLEASKWKAEWDEERYERRG